MRNPTAGRTDVDLIADVVLGQNCVTRGATDPSLIGASLPGGLAALNPLFASNYSVCSQINGPNALLGLTHWRPSTSILAPITAFAAGDQSIEGNRSLGSPEFKIAGGVQYEMPLGASHTLTPRVDAYYQQYVREQLQHPAGPHRRLCVSECADHLAPTDGKLGVPVLHAELTNSDDRRL
ncbi:MAG: hypothetical protein R3C40_07440 [Parvularculaceae bacterium]